MRRKILLIGCLLAAGISSVAAQNKIPNDIKMFGRISNAPLFDTSHRLMFSQNDYIYGTSRSAAMGGAFTSLGADLSSMSINPAGLGMYQSSDWGITQSLSINSMKTSTYQPVNLSSEGNRVSYGLNNVAMAWNIFNKSRGLTSLTFGFGYNRTANFNSKSSISTSKENVSIGDMFFQQLDVLGIYKKYGPSYMDDPNEDPFTNRNIDPEFWGSVLGYWSGLIGSAGNGYVNYFNDDTRTDSYMESVTKGGIYDYNVSLGANINNILYLGATLGYTQILYREDLTYEEIYHDNPGGFNHMWYDQSTRMDGNGFSMKLGAIVRPIPALRIGAAFHLPTYYVIEKTYYGEMSTVDLGYSGDVVDDDLRLNTAPKLLAGVSYVIADRAILSVDYERAWYNKIRMRDRDSRDDAKEKSKKDSRDNYKPANTFRAGLEIMAGDIVSIRAGGAYSMDFMKDKYAVMVNPTVKSYYTISGGLGFNIGRNAYLDATYVFNRAKYTPYDLFYFESFDTAGNNTWAYQYDNDATYLYDLPKDQRPARRDYSQKKNMHMITLTIGSRF